MAFFSSFWNISYKNREEYDLKKHQGKRFWQGNYFILFNVWDLSTVSNERASFTTNAIII